jgi:hypothetical protein
MSVPGVRITHPVQRNVRFTVTEPSIPYNTPFQCTEPLLGGCGQVHLFKTHHLNLDDTGSVIVERVLFEKLKVYLIAFGFVIANDVTRPPPQDLGLAVGPVRLIGAQHHIPIVRGEEQK